MEVINWDLPDVGSRSCECPFCKYLAWICSSYKQVLSPDYRPKGWHQEHNVKGLNCVAHLQRDKSNVCSSIGSLLWNRCQLCNEVCDLCKYCLQHHEKSPLPVAEWQLFHLEGNANANAQPLRLNADKSCNLWLSWWDIPWNAFKWSMDQRETFSCSEERHLWLSH